MDDEGILNGSATKERRQEYHKEDGEKACRILDPGGLTQQSFLKLRAFGAHRTLVAGGESTILLVERGKLGLEGCLPPLLEHDDIQEP